MAITLCKSCKNHCGYGYAYDCVNYTPNDKDKEVTTNEQWFCSLPTEEKAKILYKFYSDGRNDELQVYVSINVNSFKKWLKQPHTKVLKKQEKKKK